MKIALNALGPISPERIAANTKTNKARALPVAPCKPNRPPLAIVGGGRSVLSHVDELRVWPGHVWAINLAFHWLRDLGIKSRFYTADPMPFPGLDIRAGDDVLLATCSEPELFDQCRRGNIETFEHYTNGVVPAITSAGTSLTLALSLGYGDVTYFGCEGSFPSGIEPTHAYGNFNPVDLLRVKCNGQSFFSKLEFLHQSLMLADAIREFPFFNERSGGLLSALVKDPDWDVTHGTRALRDQLRPAVGASNPWDSAAGYHH